jgi:hypothetical protein
MNTPFFPAFRTRLAALGQRAAVPLRQATLQQLARHLADLIPIHLLSSADDGANSRERLFTLRLTCECFVWQMLQAPHRLPRSRPSGAGTGLCARPGQRG